MEQQLRILLAEDYEEIRDLAAFFLEAILHAEVTKCKSGNEAIAILKQQSEFRHHHFGL
jgi:CheY-like chemotaxis protein